MNDGEIKKKVNVAMFELMKSAGVIAPVDVLINIGVLSKEDYERWRNGQVDYLERVCKANLRKLSTVMRECGPSPKRTSLKRPGRIITAGESPKTRNFGSAKAARIISNAATPLIL